MECVHARWHSALVEACKYSSIDLAFFAALIAGESGGDARARRFEPGVFAHLQAVRDKRQASYGSLRAQDLRFNDEDLRALASSWGLTQIMGYHTLSWERQPGDLLDPKFNLTLAVRLAAQFVEAFQLDVRRDGGEYAQLFRCWNTGGPYGKTLDPKYVENGLARMEIYRALGA